ncbi:hypothetical protein JQX13_25750 [Archangium violaceum]|uniref:hypothetical protein n=1 Tax=Archangium violaceum TaxID=83451 RepID=UPI00193B87D4|nr:hypothetical protein [Archangium violaceum]QRK13130.1 hypothetical protein JQX13_25750 [Archangium violaceum]
MDALLAKAGNDLYALDDDVLAPLELQLLDVDFQGLRLRAPDRVDVSAREVLPLLQARRATGLRDWEVEPRRNAILVAVDLERGGVLHGWAFRPRKRYNPNSLDRSMQGQPPSEDNPSVHARLSILDARRLTGLPWQAGRYAFTFISWDWVSNTVTVDLTEGAAPPREPEPLSMEESGRVLEDWRALEGSVSPVPGEAGPRADGISLTVPERFRKGTGAVIQGTLRMRIPPGMVVGGVAAEGRPAAFLPVGVLLLRKDEIGPPMITATVPLPASSVRAGGEAAVVRFSLELGKVAGDVLLPGEHLLYLVAGPFIDGPHRVEVLE